MSRRAKAAQAKKLIALALGEGSDSEKTAAALKAARIISKYSLLDNPLDHIVGRGNKSVDSAVNIFDTLTDPTLLGSLKHIGAQIRSTRRSR